MVVATPPRKPSVSEDGPGVNTEVSETDAGATSTQSHLSWLLHSMAGWLDNKALSKTTDPDAEETFRVDWYRILPFMGLHVTCLAVIWVGWSPIAVAVALAMYLFRMFAITGFYHRYFSHRAFKTSRAGQFIFAVAGNCAVQRGPLWWAAHHRHHHRVSDEVDDRHSVLQHGFFWGHVGWITSRKNFATNIAAVKDLAKFPELRFLDRFDNVVPVLFGVCMFLLGVALEAWVPALDTNGWQMLIWGFFISTVCVAHATFTINSLTHMYGSKRYKSKDESRNNVWLALLTLGEGWHNNHHYYPGAARQGFYWWEIDITYYCLRMLSAVGLIWDLNPVPPHVREANHLA